MEVRDWLLVISMLLHFAYSIWGYIERRNDKTGDRIADIEARIAVVERVVGEVKAASSSAPTHNDLGKIYDEMRTLASTTKDAIRDLTGTVNLLAGENIGQRGALNLIMNRLTEKKGNLNVGNE